MKVELRREPDQQRAVGEARGTVKYRILDDSGVLLDAGNIAADHLEGVADRKDREADIAAALAESLRWLTRNPQVGTCTLATPLEIHGAVLPEKWDFRQIGDGA